LTVDDASARFDPVTRAGYELEFEDTFKADRLDERRWIPYYLPHWSNLAASAARYRLGDGCLHLVVEADQPPWCPEYDGEIRVSSLQTGHFAGPLGSTFGQHRFKPDVLVRSSLDNARLYTPQYGYFELRACADIGSTGMVALWMIGYEDEPDRSAEICICEIFGRTVEADRAAVGMGLHPFGDPRIVDEFAAETLDIDVRDFHVYAARWTPTHVEFFVDHTLVKQVQQSPDYPMQFMLDVYQFAAESGPAPARAQQFTIDYFRGYRPTDPRGPHP